MLNVCGTTFVRNAFEGGFPFESIIPALSITDNIIIVDMGSTDGTLELLQEVEKSNKRIKIVKSTWSTTTNPKAFADIANYCLDICPTPYTYFWQFDEILHENLAKNIRKQYEVGVYNMTMERIQITCGGHIIKWLPHSLVRSLDVKKYRFDKDGMTVADSGGCLHMCRNPATGEAHKGRQFPWHEPEPGKFFDPKNPTVLNSIMARVFPWDEFLVDTSSMFRDNQISKKTLHHRFWNENNISIDGIGADRWIKQAMANPLWESKEQTFPVPSLVRGLVGMTKYALRPEVKQSLLNDTFTEWGL
jgi:hypothetical protein